MKRLAVAVIGAGIAGLTCARALDAAGARVVVFDKARGPGGRISTRRGDGWAFDHGAQYFTVREPAFGAVVEGWKAAGVVDEWRGRFGRFVGRFVAETPPLPRWVGVPRMSAITRALCDGLELRAGARVTGVARDGAGWAVRCEGGAVAGFDRVVVATPAPQAVPLLGAAPSIAAAAGAAKMSATWAVMLRFADRLPLPFDAVDVSASPIAWAARDSSKPGRGEAECWVLHATADWAAAHLEDDFGAVAAALAGAFEGLCAGYAPVEAMAHRWRYALVRDAVGPAAHWDAAAGIGACGDWCVGARVDSAWRSGAAMAAAVLAG